jgi:hypothetical protein
MPTNIDRFTYYSVTFCNKISYMLVRYLTLLSLESYFTNLV